jgi:transposase-like protein
MDAMTDEQVVPEVEVTGKAERRRFSAEYKRKILKAADACRLPGELGELLRREGLYSSNLAAWRAARERGELTGLTPKRRGPKPAVKDARDRRIVELERETRKWQARAERAEALVDLQKKVSELLGITLPESDEKK